MENKLITKFENLIKTANKDLFYEYINISNLYQFFIGNIQEFAEKDRVEILSFFYEVILTGNNDFYHFINVKESFIFQGDKFREKNFRLALEYYKNRSVLELGHGDAVSLIEQNTYYTYPLIEFLRINARAIEEIFYFSEQLFRDSLETLVDQKEFYKIYSDSFYDIIIIKKNFFAEINPSFFSKDGLIIRFCDIGQIGFEKDSTILNENESLITKGFPLGNYKVLTEKVNYVTVHIKDSFFKEYNIEFPSYLLKKVAWKLDEKSHRILDKLDTFKNPKLILLKFISEIILHLTEEENILEIQVIDNLLLNKITTYIKGNLEEPISITFLQKEFGINKNTLNASFKENFGVSPAKYIINKKLERASRYLLESNLSVTDIASKLNFSSTSKFSTYFKGKFSITPLQFKKKFDKLSKK